MIIFLMTTLFFLNGHATERQEPVIEVFTLSTRPIDIKGYDASLCLMDKIGLIEKRLNEKGRKHFEAHYMRIQDELLKAYQCALKASLYGLKHLPAIVFASKEVVYGVDDMKQAKKIWEERHD